MKRAIIFIELIIIIILVVFIIYQYQHPRIEQKIVDNIVYKYKTDTVFKTIQPEQTDKSSLKKKQGEDKKAIKADKKTNSFEGIDMKVLIIPSDDNTFGYDIELNGSVMIHQPNIPGMPGNKGFKTKEQAQKVGEFVINKLKNNEMPPSVSFDDLRKLGVLN
jgi:hypothetical protein